MASTRIMVCDEGNTLATYLIGMKEVGGNKQIWSVLILVMFSEPHLASLKVGRGLPVRGLVSVNCMQTSPVSEMAPSRRHRKWEGVPILGTQSGVFDLLRI